MKISGCKIEKLNYFWITLLFVMISILIFYFCTPQQINKDENSKSSASDVLLRNMSLLKPFELQSEGYELKPDIKVFDEAGMQVSLHNILGDNSSILVYRFSEMHCDICIEQHLSILKNLDTKINSEKLVLLGSYANLKKIKIVRQTHKFNFRIYNTMDDLGIPLEQVNNPYFFILDKDLKCHSFFAAIKENPDLTVSCVQILIKKY